MKKREEKRHSLIRSGSVLPNCIYADYIQYLPKKILSYLPFIAGNQCALNEIGTVDAKNPTIKQPFFLLVIDCGKWVSM